MHKPWFLAAVMLATVLAGCADSDDAPETPQIPESGLDPITHVEDRHGLDFATNASELPWSQVLQAGQWDILPGVGQTLTIDLPLGAGLPTADVHMGLFFPDNGCDWNARMGIDPAPEASDVHFPEGGAATPDECRLPVVADVGPYWGEPLLGDVHAEDRGSGRLGEFLITNLVPHGYIIAQVSVTGTGDSTGCMDLMGEVEQASVQESVRYLGDAGFSNGAVALTGRSYDGSTPWEAAMASDLPQLKSVVPISGLFGQLDLMWKNGSAEFRGPGVLWGLYYAFTYTGNDPVSQIAFGSGPDADMTLLQARQIAENMVCAETQAGGAIAAGTYLFGSDPQPGVEGESYWQERSFRREVLENYEGSVYFIHGMQDWNVDPHMAFPFYQELESKGLEMKGLFGQWGHMYPDRVSEHPDNLRWDWAQDLLEWFDHYLKGTGDRPQLHVEMEDDHGQWRIEETWPPRDLTWHKTGMDDMIQTAGDGTQIYGQYDGVNGGFAGPSNALRFDLGALSETEDTRIAGLPQFHVAVTPDGPGGMVYAELRDATENRRIGHAIMDLRYHAGGDQMQTVVPQQPIVAKMEFFPLDSLVPAGNEVELYIATGGRDYLASAINTPVTIHADGDSVLKLPIVEGRDGQLFTPPGWED